MKVLMLSQDLDIENPSDGVALHIRHISGALAKRGADVTVAMLSQDWEDRIMEGFRLVKMVKHKWYSWIPIAPLFRLHLLVRKERPDILHVQNSPLNYNLIYAMLCQHRIPRIITVHGHPFQELILGNLLREGSVRAGLWKFSEPMITKRFDKIVCVTNSRATEFREMYGRDVESKMSVIPNGVEETSKPTRRSEDGLTILCPKALTPHNGQEFLIRAMKRILEKVQNARLFLAGDGICRRHLEDLTRELGLEEHVMMLGRIPHNEVLELLDSADVVVIPSIRAKGVIEGSSISVLEAMVRGKPVIASDIGGLSETIVDGKTGILVPERDTEQIANAVICMAVDSDKRDRIGTAAREYVLQSRTWQLIADAYLQLYRDLV